MKIPLAIYERASFQSGCLELIRRKPLNNAMKTFIYTAMGLLCASTLVAAEPIDSKVIHNYNQIGIGYNYVESDDLDGHGVIGTASVDLNNFLLGGGGKYIWFNEPEGSTTSMPNPGAPALSLVTSCG